MNKQQYIKKTQGFSLIEMAVVIAIMGILMTFGIKLATSFQNKGAFSATADRQKQIRETLTAYLAQTGELPCPADPAAMTGIESPVGVTCQNNPGIIPFQTLGLPKSIAMDGWERYFTYVVWDNSASAICSGVGGFNNVSNNSNWTIKINYPIAPFDAHHDESDGCLMIEEADANGVVINGRRAVALIISHGPNGFGGYTAKGGKIDFPDMSVENINSIETGSISTAFRTQPINLDGFDDIVMEISANDLLGPLKRNGSIVSKKQLDRDYLYTLFSVTPDASPDCKLEIDSPAALDPINSQLSPADFVTLVLAGQFNASVTISANQYCPGGKFVWPP